MTEPAEGSSEDAEHAPPDPFIGRTLREKWRIDARIGRGGMATVYEGTHRNGMRGAIKVLHPHYASDPVARRRFAREGLAANRIDHPGVVKVLDDDVTEDGVAFVVMELLAGKTWKAVWSESGKALSPREVLPVAARVLDILVAAHAAGVVHRDIKPDNVFITGDGEVKLLDFGIARAREVDGDHTQTGAMLGTPAFMAPEQAMARWSQVDERSDLFALGATLWALMSGRLLHVCETVPELLVAAATKHAEPFETVVPEATPALAALVDRAVRFDKAERFQTAVEMRGAVDRALASLDEPIPGPRRSAAKKPAQDAAVARGPRARPSFGWGIAAGILGATGVLGVVLATTGLPSFGRDDAASPAGASAESAVTAPPPPESAPPTRTSESSAELPAPTMASVSTAERPPVVGSVRLGRAGSARPSASAGKPFDAGRASAALQARASFARIQCSTLKGTRVMSFDVWFEAASGRASTVLAKPMKDGDSPAGACTIGVLHGAVVEPFTGAAPPVAVAVSLATSGSPF